MINRVVLVGRLVKDVELRYTQSGVATASFTLAVNRQFKSENGEREADFINCVMWRKNAENFANFTHKGSLVGIEGRIQTRNYENQQGTRVYVTEVVVDNFSLLEPKSANDGRQSQPSNYGGQNNFNAPNNQPMNDPFAGGRDIDITNEQLPFQIMKEYALYKGDEFICMGTPEYIAEYTGIKVASIRYLLTPSYQKRASKNSRVLVAVD